VVNVVSKYIRFLEQFTVRTCYQVEEQEHHPELLTDGIFFDYLKVLLVKNIHDTFDQISIS